MLKSRKIRLALLGAEKGLCEGYLAPQSWNNPQNKLRCVMGELLFQIGYSNEQLRGMSSTLEGDSELEIRARKDLLEEYGITEQDIKEMISLNDELEEVDDMERLYVITDMFKFSEGVV